MSLTWRELAREDHPFLVGSDMGVGFHSAAARDVVMPVHVDQLFPRHGLVRLHAQEVNPHSVGCVSNLRRVAAVTGKERVVSRTIEMHTPPGALEVIPDVPA